MRMPRRLLLTAPAMLLLVAGRDGSPAWAAAAAADGAAAEVLDEAQLCSAVKPSIQLAGGPFGDDPKYFIKQDSERLFGRPTYMTPEMLEDIRTSSTGYFIYFCPEQCRYMLAMNNCHRDSDEGCDISDFEQLRWDEEHNARGGSTHDTCSPGAWNSSAQGPWCPGIAYPEHRGEELSLHGAPWTWSKDLNALGFSCGAGSKILLMPAVAQGLLVLFCACCLDLSALLKVWAAITLIFSCWCVSAYLQCGWLGWAAEVSVTFEVVSQVPSCVVVPNHTLPHAMNSPLDLEPFCLGGWGEPRRSGLCLEGLVQRPQPLQCFSGRLNVAETWTCGGNPSPEKLLDFESMPPFYYIFLTGLLKMVIMMCALGPPKPGAAISQGSRMQKLKWCVKRASQVAVFASALVGFASDIWRACRMAYVSFDPVEIRGLTTPLLHASPFVRAYASMSLAVCTSGVIANIASTKSLKELYRDRLRLLFAHEGERILEQRHLDGDPVPLDKRHGIENAFEIAGHTQDEWQMALADMEGPIVARYVRFVEAVSPLYFGLLGPWFVLGGLLFCWTLGPYWYLVQVVSDSLAAWTVRRAERRANTTRGNSSSPGSGEERGETRAVSRDQEMQDLHDAPSTRLLAQDADLQALQDPDAVFFFMLEWEDRRAVKITRDEAVTFTPAVKQDKRVVSAKTLKAGATCATAPLKYKSLCHYPNQRKTIKVGWTERDEDDEDSTKFVSTAVPVQSVVPVYDLETAKREYASKLRSFHATGTTQEAWKAYFSYALLAPLATCLVCTLAARLVLFWLCWPPVEGMSTGNFFGIYGYSVVATLGERHLTTYLANNWAAVVTACTSALEFLDQGPEKLAALTEALSTVARSVNLFV